MKLFKKFICLILIFMFLFNYIPVVVLAAQSETTPEVELSAKKYVIDEENMLIKRVLPETEVDNFKAKFNVPKENIAIYTDETCSSEVTTGFVTTGMVLKVLESSNAYTVNVIGDFDNDGRMGEIELSQLIKHIVGMKEHKLSGEKLISSDINGDGKTDQLDLTILIRWIVYRELNIPEVDMPDSPIIEVIEGEKAENNWYKSNVKIKITEGENKGLKIVKTTYSINGGEEKVINSTDTITLSENGKYRIAAYTYTKDGAKSRAQEEINIEKQAQLLQDNISVTSSTTKRTITVNTQVPDYSIITEYNYYIGQKDEENNIVYKKESSTLSTHTFTALDYNTKYYVKVEAKTEAGHTLTKEIEVTTKDIVHLTDNDITIEKSEDGWTNKDLVIEIGIKENEQINKDDYKIEYSTDGGTTFLPYDEDEKVKVEENTEIIIKITDEEGNTTTIEKEISNIDKTEPTATMGLNATTNSIRADVTATDGISGVKNYTYYLGTKNSENKVVYSSGIQKNNATHTFTGLTHNSTYYVKVEVTDNAGNVKTLENEVKTAMVPTSGSSNITTSLSETGWTKNDIVLTINQTGSTVDGCYIEYSIDGRTWNRYNEETGVIITQNTNVKIRLTDGTNTGEETNVVIDKIDKKAPTVTITNDEVTTKSITVSANAEDTQSGMPENPTYKYYIKKTTETNYPDTPDYTGTMTTHIFNNLDHNTSYDIKVTTKDNVNNEGEKTLTNITTLQVGGATGNLETGNIILKSTTWRDGLASIVLTTTTGLDIQYKKGASGQWVTGTMSNTEIEGTTSTTVTDLHHNGIVIVRLTDGRNYGAEANLTILDGTAPQEATISLSKTSAWTNENITATVTHTDNESGVSIENCKWILNNTSGDLGITNSDWDTANSFDSNPKTINLKQSTQGTYYLHVLTVDNAGNKEEATSVITINQRATGITLNKTSEKVEKENTLQLIATITPDNATNKNVTWSSSNSNVATVNNNGLVTAKGAGSATITAATCDGTNITASCNIEVIPTVEDLTDIQEENVTVKDSNGEQITVPGGFKVVASEATTIDEGIVIEDEKHNQFVWVPVPDEKISSLYGVDSSGKKLGKTYYYVSDAKEDGNWKEENGIMSIKTENMDREPYYASQYDGSDATRDSSFFTSVMGNMTGSQFLDLLQDEFDTMIESVKKYKGFYIGRYETGNLVANKNNIPVVKKGENKISGISWYYQYYTTKNIIQNNSNVITSMIWGCQWDRTLDWLGETGTKRYEELKDSRSWGNYSDSTGSAVSNSGTKRTTGYSEAWKANNIYDLAGNVAEWTMTRGQSTHTRVGRGGFFDESGNNGNSNVCGFSNYGLANIGDSGTGRAPGSRATLIINPSSLDKLINNDSFVTPEQGNQIVNDKTGKTMVVPVGYKVTNDTNEIDKGVIIEDELKNQFVWVPVNDEQFDEMFGTTGSGDSINYFGKLYNFTDTGKGEAMNSAIGGDSGYREPDIIKDYDGVHSAYTTVMGSMTANDFKTELQNSFNDLAKSVKKYKGFYIGRYETGSWSASDKNNVPKVQKGQTVELNGVNWYYQYEETKKLSKMKSASNDYVDNPNVEASMIWGCQWDRTLEWIAQTNLTEDGNPDYSLLIDSSKWGNHSNYNKVTGDTSTASGGSEPQLSGTNQNWQKNNIFDLAGNEYEWTIETNDGDYRVRRGGRCSHSGNKANFPVSARFNAYVYFDAISSRSTLYINPETISNTL